MSNLAEKNPAHKQWHLLLVYSCYRLCTILLFLGIYYYNSVEPIDSYIYSTILLAYLICALLFLYLCYYQKDKFERQVLWSGTIDIIAISTMLIVIGNIKSGYGISLNVTVAALSILVPGRLAIFFAALSSCLLLCGNLIQYFFYYEGDSSLFFYSGIYGAGFFATAGTAWYMANWVSDSQSLIQHRNEELAGMQRINEYIVERLHSGVIYVDVNKQIKLINSAARTFFSIPQNSSPPSLHDLSLSLAEKLDQFLVKIKQHDSTAQTVLEAPFLRVHFFSTTVANNPAVLIILEDMTYISQQAQQLKLASLGRFSASIAHELRNPLGAIAHAAQLFGDEGELNSGDVRLKELIINNCDRMNGVIKNVLQLSRREKAQPELIQMVEFLEQFKQDFCHYNSCDFTIECVDNKFSLLFDKSQLEQILVIICDNAIQHGKNDRENVSIKIILKSMDHKNMIMVCDSGKGVPDEYIDNVFEPFFTTLRTGTGMGLFIAKDLCEINQAHLSLEKSTHGSCFVVTLNTSEELII